MSDTSGALGLGVRSRAGTGTGGEVGSAISMVNEVVVSSFVTVSVGESVWPNSVPCMDGAGVVTVSVSTVVGAVVIKGLTVAVAPSVELGVASDDPETVGVTVSPIGLKVGHGDETDIVGELVTVLDPNDDGAIDVPFELVAALGAKVVPFIVST